MEANDVCSNFHSNNFIDESKWTFASVLKKGEELQLQIQFSPTEPPGTSGD